MSHLQKYILRHMMTAKRAVPKAFLSFYSRRKTQPSLDDQQTAIHRSLERLVEQGYLVGYGRKTQQKWYLDQVRLTPAGMRKAKQLFTQPQLPFIKRTHAHTKKS